MMRFYIFLTLVFLSFPIFAQQPAFPGAEGHGMYTTGGRGGRVIKVTNLNDSGEGSFRAAVEAEGPRIVVFDVSGTIALESKLIIQNNDITIAGQTAPGDGICIRNYCVYITASNVIIRYLRFRMGDEAMQEDDALGGQGSKNMIIDHCSMSWSTDECASFYANENFTMQWCLIGESLVNSVHEKGSHGYGGIWGGNKASFHHNLLANQTNRNPRLRGHKLNSPTDAELVDLRNNVIYNYKGICYGSEGGGNYNFVNNYYKPGPGTEDKLDRILSINITEAEYNWLELEGAHGIFYVDGNYVHGNPTVTQSNWKGVEIESLITPENAKSTIEFEKGNIKTDGAETAYEKVLAYAGASIFRDDVDKRTIHDALTGTATIMDGGNGSTNGFIDTQDAVGGWPILKSLPAPIDTDNDGMPDDWELTYGLDPYDSFDANTDYNNDGYTNIEKYINSLALVHFDTEPVIKLFKPTKNDFFLATGAFTDVEVHAQSNDYNQGELVSIQLFLDNELIIESTDSNEISLNLKKVPIGLHQLSIVVEDNTGNVATEKINFYVGNNEISIKIAESPNGKAILDPPGGRYDDGFLVTAEAIPNEGYSFIGWEGDLVSVSGKLEILTSGDIEIKPVFKEKATEIFSKPIKINFQPEENFSVPAGYLPDIGGNYTTKISGYTYGWRNGFNGSTGIQPNEIGVWETFRKFKFKGNVFSWELSLPNGVYKVKLGLGIDEMAIDTVGFLAEVEGLALHQSDYAKTAPEIILDEILVEDGKLTISGSEILRIYFIEVESLEE